MKPIDLPIDADLARRLMIEARRRAPDADPREAVRTLLRGTLVELLERLEDDQIARPRSRWDRPEYYEYTFETHVHCGARCGAEVIVRSVGLDTDEARAERERQAAEEAATRGWLIDHGHRCPACAMRFAEGTAPGTERLHGDRCMCAGAGCRERPAR